MDSYHRTHLNKFKIENSRHQRMLKIIVCIVVTFPQEIEFWWMSHLIWLFWGEDPLIFTKSVRCSFCLGIHPHKSYFSKPWVWISINNIFTYSKNMCFTCRMWFNHCWLKEPVLNSKNTSSDPVHEAHEYIASAWNNLCGSKFDRTPTT